MWVQCVTADVEEAIGRAADEREREAIRRRAGKSGQMHTLVPDEYYLVYALHMKPECTDFVVGGLDRSMSSAPCPEEYFRVIDGRLSKYWRFQQGEKTRFLGISGWDFSFFSALIDSEPAANERFTCYARAMTYEYAHPEVDEPVDVLRDNWVWCPDCMESWQIFSRQEMVMCPGCRTHWLNPFADSFR